MSLKEVRKQLGGELLGADVSFNSVSIDTRTLKTNDLFVAISGPNFDGNDFLAQAEEKGACGAVVSKAVSAKLPMLKVNDTRQALGQLGAVNRNQSHACVLALTGSQGKTSVKEMCKAILDRCGKTLSTRGNLNNELGVPLTLLDIEESHDFAVIEMGASAVGEIAYTVNLAKPHIAHVTNAAGTHLEGFGSLDNVALAKGEIFEGLSLSGTAVVNIDDVYGESWIRRAGERNVVTVSAKGNVKADYYASDIELDETGCPGFQLNSQKGMLLIKLKVLGEHNVANALAAAAMCMEAGAGLEAVEKGLGSIGSVPGRLSRKPGLNGSLIIDDSYNASPSSFKAAIDVLARFKGETLVVMGDMGELGSEEVKAHKEVGEYAKHKGVTGFLTCGSLSREAVEAFGGGAQYFDDQDSLIGKLKTKLKADVVVLVKGSRSARMDKVVQQIIKRGA